MSWLRQAGLVIKEFFITLFVAVVIEFWPITPIRLYTYEYTHLSSERVRGIEMFPTLVMQIIRIWRSHLIKMSFGDATPVSDLMVFSSSL